MAAMKRIKVTTRPQRVPVSGWVDQVTVYAEGGAIRTSYAEDEQGATLHYRPIPQDGETTFEVGGLRSRKDCDAGLWVYHAGQQDFDVVITWEAVSRRVRE